MAKDHQGLIATDPVLDQIIEQTAPLFDKKDMKAVFAFLLELFLLLPLFSSSA